MIEVFSVKIITGLYYLAEVTRLPTPSERFKYVHILYIH